MVSSSISQPSHTCHTCGSGIPVGSEGHCPECLCRLALFLDDPADESEETAETVEPPVQGTESWTHLGDCDLYEELGRGGMGIVYRARHRRLGRQMAVKVLRGGELADARARQRFHAEAETAASLQHPGIVTIHDVDEEQGVCWYSMELIAGRTLDNVVRSHPMASKDAAQCLATVAVAVEHAHAHGVLHRDLKPSNIILDIEGQPHVTDFGIARRIGAATAATAATRTGAATGSPGYAAPEQVQGVATDVRTDVYGLGGILYHVLTGRPPFHGPTSESVLMQMRDHDPLRPRSLNPAVARDLETICLKALAREPSRRYSTAAELAKDLACYLDGRPILARPSSLIEKTWRWCRRRPAQATALLLAALAIAAGTTASLWSAVAARQSESRAILSEEAALKSEKVSLGTAYAATLLRAQSEIATGSARASWLLKNLTPKKGKPDLRHWEWHYLHGLLDQSTIVRTEPLRQARRSVAWSPDGRTYATAVCSGTQRQSEWSVAICDGTTNAEMRHLPHGEWDVAYLSWHPDGKRLATADDAAADRIWDVTTGTLISSFIDKSPTPNPADYYAHLIAWSPDGQWLATAVNGRSAEAGLRIRKASDGAEVHRFPGDLDAIAWHPDSGKIAAAHMVSGIMELHHINGSAPMQRFPQGSGISALAFNKAGLLAAGTYTSYLRMIDPAAPDRVLPGLATNQSCVRLIHWVDEDRSLLTGGWNGLIAQVNAAPLSLDHYLWGHDRLWLQSLSVHGDQALTWADDGTLRRWRIGGREEDLITPSPLKGLQWVGDTLFPITRSLPDSTITSVTWQPTATSPLMTETIALAGTAVWSPDGQKLAVVHPSADTPTSNSHGHAPPGSIITIRRRDRLTLVESRFSSHLDVRDVYWSPAGDRLLLAQHRQPITHCAVISATDGQEVCRLPPLHQSFHHLRALPIPWSPDGSRIALWGGGVIYDAATGQPTAEGLRLSQTSLGFPVESIAWSPDSTRLAVGGAD